MHVSAITDGGYGSLEEGQQVEFDITQAQFSSAQPKRRPARLARPAPGSGIDITQAREGLSR